MGGVLEDGLCKKKCFVYSFKDEIYWEKLDAMRGLQDYTAVGALYVRKQQITNLMYSRTILILP